MKAYGELQLSVTSPPQSFTEPLSLTTAKNYLKVSGTDDDDLINLLIRSARGMAEVFQGVDLVVKQQDLHLDLLVGSACSARFDTPYRFEDDLGIDLRYPLRSVDLFQITDSAGNATTLTEGISGDYRVDLNRARVLPPYAKSWPSYVADVSSSVLIRFTSGYTSTDVFWQDKGAFVLQGMMLLVSSWYETRLPFDPAIRGQIDEFPFAITTLLSHGARPRVH